MCCFTHWKSEAMRGTQAQHHLGMQEELNRLNSLLFDTNQHVTRLETALAEQQQAVDTYQQQIDRITETLQRELQTKEELANELRDAYATSDTRATPVPSGHLQSWSRNSSEHTLDPKVGPMTGRTSTLPMPSLP